MPESASDTWPLTLTSARRVVIARAGRVKVTMGAVMSIPIVTDAVFSLPAASTALPVTGCAAPSAVTVTGDEQNATPDASEQRNVTVTGVFIQFEMTAGNVSATIVGGVTSSTPRDVNTVVDTPPCCRTMTTINDQTLRDMISSNDLKSGA